MISILITLLVAVLVCGIIYWIVTLLPLPEPFKKIAMVIVALIFLVWLLSVFGVWGPAWRVPIGR